MSITHHRDWLPVRKYIEGIQPHTGRHWHCSPAWDIVALFKTPAEKVKSADPEHEEYVHVDRHIDRRFSLEYPLSKREAPRTQTPTEPDPDRAWERLVETRDRYLKSAGLTPESPAGDVARALAETFKCDHEFGEKPGCTTYPDDHRALVHPLDGLLHKSFCVGCATAYVALVESLGLPARNIGCGAHWIAEVLVDGTWHMVENTCRHDKNKGILDAFFESSYLDILLDPTGDHGGKMHDDYRKGLSKRPNAQVHFSHGMWQSPLTVRTAAGCVHALYPDRDTWGIKSTDPKRMYITACAGGFYHSSVHSTFKPEIFRMRQNACPRPLYRGTPEGLCRDLLYHPFRPGDRLRRSVWLGDIDDTEALEAVLPFGASRDSDFGPETGKSLFVQVGEWKKSIHELGAWPPRDPQTGLPLQSTIRIPADALKGNAVNWIEIVQESGTLFHAPFLPEAQEPYVPPLYTESDPVNPPVRMTVPEE